MADRDEKPALAAASEDRPDEGSTVRVWLPEIVDDEHPALGRFVAAVLEVAEAEGVSLRVRAEVLGRPVHVVTSVLPAAASPSEGGGAPVEAAVRALWLAFGRTSDGKHEAAELAAEYQRWRRLAASGIADAAPSEGEAGGARHTCCDTSGCNLADEGAPPAAPAVPGGVGEARRRALLEAVQVVYRSVTPLGAYGGATDSPWNKGYTQARDQAVAAISALVEPTTGMDSGLVIEAPPVPGGGLDREALRRVVLNAMHGGAACRVMAGWCVHESTADRVVAALAPLLTGGERDG